ncbi:MAG TPA: chemotaxis protein CheB, partial [Pseudobdellovibrionaceae bacterium]|nr:chemotaxis protein CheB [Pseudobdellovibrionaceae bacterium]
MNKKIHKGRQEFPIVGVGASAGGLEAFSQFLPELPLNTGMAFVLVQHLDPNHESLSSEILSKTTKLPVHEVTNGVVIQPNHVYVIPSNFNMKILNGELKLLPRIKSRAPHLSIDFFFKSLAQEVKNKAIGVVLSGAAFDGTEGLRAIKAAGGVTFAQDPKTATYESMPSHAIDSGFVDRILSPQEIARELGRHSEHALVIGKKSPTVVESDNEDLLKIFLLIKSYTGVDFSDYKHTTIQRRIERRMMAQKAETLSIYTNYLTTHPEEIKALYSDILISVTEFFRDKDAFRALVKNVFPIILNGKNIREPLRIWVPGCATGEEAYSILILLIEYLGKKGDQLPIQLFASDISEQALQVARLATYSESAIHNINPKLLEKYFTFKEGSYKVNKALREMCLFSKHDLTRDPPFAKMDLISCRNLLIYFSPVLQKRILPVLHYALKPAGILWLGKSESLSSNSKLFTAVEKGQRFYTKINTPSPLPQRFPANIYTSNIVKDPKGPLLKDLQTDFQSIADRIVLAKFSPPGVVINAQLEILQFRGKTSPYLEPAPGLPTNNLLKMTKSALQSALRKAIDEAIQQNRPIKKTEISFEDQGLRKNISIEVMPINPLAPIIKRFFLIFFEEPFIGNTTVDSLDQKSQKLKIKSKKGSQGIAKVQSKPEKLSEKLFIIENELASQKEYQQALIEEHETTQEELIATNEELSSANEELQSTNEELQTAKEETQATNEELNTVNDELRNRNQELATLSNDINNFLITTEIPLVMVDGNHRIRRFTPKAEKLFKLISSDIGRPLGDIRPDFDVNLDLLVSEVTNLRKAKEIEIQDRNGYWIRLQIRPYMTVENRMDGAVITAIDINALKVAMDLLKSNLEHATSVADALNIPSLIFDQNLRIKAVNPLFCKIFNLPVENLEGHLITELENNKNLNFKKLKIQLEDMLFKHKPFQDFEVSGFFSEQDHKKTFLLKARQILSSKTQEYDSKAVLVSFHDITEQKKYDHERNRLLTREQLARHEAEKANIAKDVFLATLSHELRTPLTAILFWSQLIQSGKVDLAKSQEGAVVIERNAKAQNQLIDDLLDISRIIAGKLTLNIQKINPSSVISTAVDSIRHLAEEKFLQINISINRENNSEALFILGDPIRMQQILWNLLTNAIKFSPKESSIEVVLGSIINEKKSYAAILVIDHGVGFSEEFLPLAFNRFSQADSTSTRSHGGLGLGLSIVKSLVELQGGTVKVENSVSPKSGAIFTIWFPVVTADVALNSTILNAAKNSKINQEIPSDREPPSLVGLRVLIVDDDKSTREALAIYIKSFGADVSTAESAQEALEELPRFKPHLLLSDIAMPVEDGYSLIRKIRNLEIDQDQFLPAIALTAYATA